jgi:hypothetical protein
MRVDVTDFRIDRVDAVAALGEAPQGVFQL